MSLDVNNSKSKLFDVERGFTQLDREPDEALRIKFDTLTKRLRKKPSEIYNQIGISKSFWSKIINGRIIPNHTLQLKIANVLEVDTLVIWGNRLSDDEIKVLGAKPYD